MAFQPRQLEAFRLVMLKGSMTAAAADIGISQPAVSRLITDLETDAGFRLFERINNKLIPTAEARQFQEYVERWYVGMQHIAKASDRIRDTNQGHITLAAMSGLSVGLLNHMIGRFLEPRPEVTFRLEVGSSETTMRLLNTFQADVGIVQWQPSTDAVNIIKLPTLDAICIMRDSHRLSSHTFVRVEDLEGEDLISMAPNSPLRLRTDAALLHAGVSVKRRIESSIAASICELVLLGFGVAVTNPFTVQYMHAKGLTWRPFKPALPYEIAVAVPRHRTMSKLIESFIVHLKSELGAFADDQSMFGGDRSTGLPQ